MRTIYALDTKTGDVLAFDDKGDVQSAAFDRNNTAFPVNTKSNINELLTSLGGEWTAPSGIRPRYVRITAAQAKKIKNGRRPAMGRWCSVRFCDSPRV